MVSRVAGCALWVAWVIGHPAPLASQSQEAGRAVYERSCASCHEDDDRGAPRLGILQAMTAEDLAYVLTEGRMAQQGRALTSEDRNRLITYLAAPRVEHAEWIESVRCSVDRRTVDPYASGGMRRLGVDLVGSRSISAEDAGLSARDLADLEVAWVLAFPGVTALRSSPAVIGSTVFYTAVNTRRVLALDAETGCVKWAYDSESPLRSGITVAELDGRPTLFFGDGRGQVHAVDAGTGARLWVRNARIDDGSGNITGAVTVYEGKVIVPLSASGVTAGGNPTFECCVGRGAVTALDAATGERLWSWVTMEEARYTGEVARNGTRLRGPSGAPIWSTPTIDVERGRVYVTTGENTSLPATETSDAIVALDLETGREIWRFQAIQRDIWHYGCFNDGPTCPSADESIRQDWDFGGSAVLAALPDGGDILVAGAKSGHLWAVDPEDGEVVWAQRRGGGGWLGGNHWGIAVDDQRAFLTINDPSLGPEGAPGVYAFDLATGAPAWDRPIEPDCTGGVPGCDRRFGISATPLVVDGAVVVGGLDGRIHVLDGETGEVMARYATARSFETINGVEGTGGSIESHSVGVGGGMLLVGSGYNLFSEIPGNVLIAFRPRR